MTDTLEDQACKSCGALPAQEHDTKCPVYLNGLRQHNEAPAANVVEALRRVMRDLPAIGKDQRASQQQGGYAYRGIEDITRAAQGLFARHGVAFVPEVVSMEIRELTVNSKPWTDTILHVRYHVYGPGGLALNDSDTHYDDKITVGPIVGIGRDNSDKGANKAMTQAFKYALIQTFCIADAKDDADGDGGSPEADTYSQTARAGAARGPDEEPTAGGNVRRGPRMLDGWADIDDQRAAHDAFEAAAKDRTEEVREAIKAWRKDQGYGYPMTRAELEATADELDRLAAPQGEQAPEPAEPADAPPDVAQVCPSCGTAITEENVRVGLTECTACAPF